MPIPVPAGPNQNPATTSDLTDRGYTLPPGNTAQTRLDEAWRALKREPDLPDLVVRLAEGDLDRDDVVDVICAGALRVLRNTDGVEEESGQIDDFRESRRYADATQDVYFTSAELRRLARPEAPALTAGSFKYS